MVMKDKLVKNHHKGMYYRMRKATLILLASFTFAAAIVVPTYISSISHKKSATGFAAEINSNSEETKSIEDSKEEKEEEQYEKYNDQ